MGDRGARVRLRLVGFPVAGGGALIMLRRGIEAITRVCMWISGALLVVIMAINLGEVVMRDVFSSTLRGTIEISEVLLVFFVYFGIAHTQEVRGHVNTNIMTSRVPRRVAEWSSAVGYTAALVVVIWATQVTTLRAIEAVERGEARFGLMGVPIWPARIAVAFGFGLLALEILFTVIDLVRGANHSAPSPEY